MGSRHDGAPPPPPGPRAGWAASAPVAADSMPTGQSPASHPREKLSRLLPLRFDDAPPNTRRVPGAGGRGRGEGASSSTNCPWPAQRRRLIRPAGGIQTRPRDGGTRRSQSTVTRATQDASPAIFPHAQCAAAPSAQARSSPPQPPPPPLPEHSPLHAALSRGGTRESPGNPGGRSPRRGQHREREDAAPEVQTEGSGREARLLGQLACVPGVLDTNHTNN